jgi:hypothetical protein
MIVSWMTSAAAQGPEPRKGVAFLTYLTPTYIVQTVIRLRTPTRSMIEKQ